jgi:hypothetical protein
MRNKEMVTIAPVLKYFDPKEPVTIQFDSSSFGLGATLLQGAQPVFYALQSLTKTEKNCAQIEKECLAILFACKRFHQYLRNIELESDQKPLEDIFRKMICDAKGCYYPCKNIT